MACDRTLAASDQLIAALTVGTTGVSGQDVISIQSVAEKRDFVPNDYFLSGAYKYTPTGQMKVVELRKHIKGVDTPF